ncbi:MAG: hypothetical protein GXP53_06080 [Deltaproteobacteria bacterium]|nr:hypothetical protein [Deltaproteobacteria bacterium]
MENGIAIVSSDQTDCDNLADMLKSEPLKTVQANSIKRLEEFLDSDLFIAALIDIDLISVTNPMVRELTLKYPGVAFLCMSSRAFHPELKDAICYHIYACFQKPVDKDEFLYLVRSICRDSVNTDE